MTFLAFDFQIWGHRLVDPCDPTGDRKLGLCYDCFGPRWTQSLCLFTDTLTIHFLGLPLFSHFLCFSYGLKDSMVLPGSDS